MRKAHQYEMENKLSPKWTGLKFAVSNGEFRSHAFSAKF